MSDKGLNLYNSQDSYHIVRRLNMEQGGSPISNEKEENFKVNLLDQSQEDKQLSLGSCQEDMSSFDMQGGGLISNEKEEDFKVNLSDQSQEDKQLSLDSYHEDMSSFEVISHYDCDIDSNWSIIDESDLPEPQ